MILKFFKFLKFLVVLIITLTELELFKMRKEKLQDLDLMANTTAVVLWKLPVSAAMGIVDQQMDVTVLLA